MYALRSPLQVVAIAGSLRAASYNRGLVRAAQDVAPRGLTITIRDLAPIPLYNADAEAHGDPPPVAQLKAAVREADALLPVGPEDNTGVAVWMPRPAPARLGETARHA